MVTTTARVFVAVTVAACVVCDSFEDVGTMVRSTDGAHTCALCHLFARETALPVRDERVGCTKCGNEHALCREHPVLGWGCDDCTATEESAAYADGAMEPSDVGPWVAGRGWRAAGRRREGAGHAHESGTGGEVPSE